MCLTSRRKEPFIAHEDIICYKIIKIDSDNPKHWRGLYYDNDEFEFGKVNALGKVSSVYNEDRNCKYLGKGFIHAMTNLSDAKIRLAEEECTNFFRFSLKLVKCIVPKGNEYYISIDYKEICSPSMIVYNSLNPYDKNKKHKNLSFIIYLKSIFNKFKTKNNVNR